MRSLHAITSGYFSVWCSAAASRTSPVSCSCWGRIMYCGPIHSIYGTWPITCSRLVGPNVTTFWQFWQTSVANASPRIYTPQTGCTIAIMQQTGDWHISCIVTLRYTLQLLFYFDFFTFYVVILTFVSPHWPGTMHRAGAAPTNFWWWIDWLIRLFAWSDAHPSATRARRRSTSLI